MSVQTQTRYYTPAEYLALEDLAEFKSEYHDGEIIPRSGGTTNHNRIAGNFYKIFPLQIQSQSYQVFMADVRLWLSSYHRFVYPDVMVIQGKPVYQDEGKTTVTNPLLIVEVLSKSTKSYDRTDKFDYYRSLPSFQEYLLIEQDKFEVQHYAKTANNQWLLTEYKSADAIISLAAIPWQLSLNQLYTGVDFDEQ